MAKKILLLASGGGTLAESVIDAVISKELDCQIVAVISDRPAPVLELAQRKGCPSALVNFSDYSDRETWSEELEKVVECYSPDLVVSVGFMRILSSHFVDRFPIINTHPALLPLFPGAHAVRDALASGATETGTTVHWVDAGVDTGKVISQVKVAVIPGDTEESLHERIKIQERILIVETLKTLAQSGLEK